MENSQFKTCLLSSESSPHFSDALELYSLSFPPHEQRSIKNLIATLSHPDFRFTLFLNSDNLLVGMLNTWHTSGFTYVEHFAVSPNYRNGGIGQHLLNQLTTNNNRQIILEIDPLEDEISRRRFNFYKRNGFVSNEEYDYIHPPYKKGDFPYALLVMSYKNKLSAGEYKLFENYHHTVVVQGNI